MYFRNPARRPVVPEGYAGNLSAFVEMVHGEDWPSLRRARLLSGIGCSLRNEAETLGASGDKELAKCLITCATMLGNTSNVVDRRESDNMGWNDGATAKKIGGMRYDALGKFLSGMAQMATKERWSEGPMLEQAAEQAREAWGILERREAEKAARGNWPMMLRPRKVVASL